MFRYLASGLLLSLGLCAQQQPTLTSELAVFRAVLSPANEVPAVTGLNASGMGTVLAHIVRDANGQVQSGTVDFNVDFSFPGAVRFVGMHIHRGAATVAGPVTINSGIAAAAPAEEPSGRGNVTRQGQVLPTDTEGVRTLTDMLRDPGGFYLNLHTPENPGGAIRGQLQRADVAVLMAPLSPANETPPIRDLNASGLGAIIALRTRSASGATTSGQVTFLLNYAFPEQVTFTGMHIHAGPAGVAAPVTINSGIGGAAGNVTSESSGTGSLARVVEVPMNSPTAVETLDRLFTDPQNFYFNVHTTVNTGGAIRAQLRNTDMLSFPVQMLPSNEVPAVTGLDARGIGEFRVHVLRDTDGSVASAVVIFDVNHRFPSRAEFTGLHIHNGTASESGPVSINSGLTGTAPVVSETGFGNVFRIVPATGSALTAVQSLARNPENHYINLHTTTNPSGVVRAQLGAGSTAVPVVTAAISAISEAARTTVAPGGLMTVFGTNLTKVAGTLGGFPGEMVPTELNGSSVLVDGRAAPLIVVTPAHAVVQVPVETPAGQRAVIVRNANGAGQPFNVTVAAAAPAIFFDANGGIVVNNSNFLLVRPENPARAGDILLIYSTGLGQTTPPIQTGRVVNFPPQSNTQLVSVTIGGQNADVVYSIASPGFVGLYQTAVRVPSGITAGNNVPLVLRAGDAASNTVNIAVR